MSLRNWTPRIGLAILASGLLLATACDDQAGAEGPVGSDTAAVNKGADPGAKKGDRHGKRGHKDKHKKGGKRGHKGKHGFKGLVHHALAKLELEDEQRTKIEKLRDELEPSDDDRGSHQAFMKAAADGIRAGSIDEKALSDEIAAIKEKMTARRDRWATALEGLHGVLTPEQRKTLVADMRAKHERKLGPRWFGEEAAEGADAPEPAEDKPKADKRGPKGRHKMGKHKGCKLDKMLGRLELTDEQLGKLATAQEGLEKDLPTEEELTKRRDERKQKHEAFLKAFESDTFDAKALLIDEEYTPAGRGMRMERMLKTAKVYLPILTEEQRGQLADMLTKRADKKERRGPKKERRGPKK